MNRDNEHQADLILAVIGLFPVIWLGLMIAPAVSGGDRKSVV